MGLGGVVGMGYGTSTDVGLGLGGGCGAREGAGAWGGAHRLTLPSAPQDGRGELIFYERPDSAGPKLSQFTITPTDDPDGLEVRTVLLWDDPSGAGVPLCPPPPGPIPAVRAAVLCRPCWRRRWACWAW